MRSKLNSTRKDSSLSNDSINTLQALRELPKIRIGNKRGLWIDAKFAPVEKEEIIEIEPERTFDDIKHELEEQKKKEMRGKMKPSQLLEEEFINMIAEKRPKAKKVVKLLRS